MPEKRLVMIGDGPEMKKLRSKAGPNVEFVGFQGPQVVRDYLSRAKAFIFPSEEDFGIVPVEAQACGTPVIAYGSGGALETVIGLETERSLKSPPTGVFFEQQTAASLMEAVARFEAASDQFGPNSISEHAAAFAPRAFKINFREQVNLALRERSYAPQRPATDRSLAKVAAAA